MIKHPQIQIDCLPDFWVIFFFVLVTGGHPWIKGFATFPSIILHDLDPATLLMYVILIEDLFF